MEGTVLEPSGDWCLILIKHISKIAAFLPSGSCSNKHFYPECDCYIIIRVSSKKPIERKKGKELKMFKFLKLFKLFKLLN